MPQQPRRSRILQETKLMPPSRSGGLLARDALLSRTLAAARSRLLLVVGPAGFGKTSVLVNLHQALGRSGARTGWISLDEADDDHARFLLHLVGSFRRHDARFGASLSALLDSRTPSPGAALRTRLLNELARIEGDCFLFLDDYHRVASPEVCETVNALLAAPLGHVHLIVASRSRNELPVGRLQSLGQMSEIGSGDLAFTEQETRDFLAATCGRPIDAGQASLLHARTEGWAASLQLASIALDGSADVQGFLSRFSGETRSIGDFLGDEVLRRQSADVQDFLMDVSILERFDAPLAARVTERTDARALLDEIEARNLFLYSLDDRRSWYRFHHLFADFLRRRLRDRAPERVAVLHARAAAALAAAGDPSEAVDHAFLAGDPDWAGRLLDDACLHLFATGQIATLQRQAARLPPATLRTLPRLQLELSWDDEIQWRFEEARAALRNVEDRLREDGAAFAAMSRDDLSLLESRCLHRQMMLELFCDRLPGAMALCRRWLEERRTDDPFMRASVSSATMHIDCNRYRVDGAPAQAERLRAEYVEGGAIYGTIFHDSVAACAFFMRGELEEAERTLLRARAVAHEVAGERSSAAAMTTALLAEARYERGDLPRARDLLGEHASFSAEFGFLDQAVARFVTASRLASAEGRPDDAESVLEAGVFVAGRYGFLRLLAHLTAERVRRRVLAGCVREAAAILADPEIAPWVAQPSPGDAPDTTRELFALAWARVAVAGGDAGSAVLVLKRWFAFVRGRRCHRSALRIGVLLAQAHAAASDANAARRVLLELLPLARGGFVRTFVDEGPALLRILESLRADLATAGAGLEPALASILHAAGRPREQREPADDAAAEERLSDRELEIVRLSAEGMATSDIARATGLTDSTVKWYWQRIFAKLGVHRRFDAVKLARKRRWMA